MGRFKIGDWAQINDRAPISISGMSAEVIGVHDDFGEYLLNLVDYGLGQAWILDMFLDPCSPRYGDVASEAESSPAKRPPCSFCGEAVGAASSHNSGLRAQAETWHVCYKPTCRGSIDLHTQRIEAGLFDTPETRAATRAWYVAKLEREEREARASRLAAMVQP